MKNTCRFIKVISALRVVNYLTFRLVGIYNIEYYVINYNIIVINIIIPKIPVVNSRYSAS